MNERGEFCLPRNRRAYRIHRIMRKRHSNRKRHLEGYKGDWHNITLHNVSGDPYVILLKGHKYNYTIVTGPYPQIIHAHSKEVTGGTITCTSFVDTNGRKYNDWIPAIRLE